MRTNHNRTSYGVNLATLKPPCGPASCCPCKQKYVAHLFPCSWLRRFRCASRTKLFPHSQRSFGLSSPSWLVYPDCFLCLKVKTNFSTRPSLLINSHFSFQFFRLQLLFELGSDLKYSFFSFILADCCTGL